MPAFEFTALDLNGREHKGVLEGDSPRQVRQQLRDRQWTPLAVQEVAAREAKSALRFSLRRGVAASDLALMTRQLATLVRSGLPLEEAVRAVSQQTEKARLKSMLLGVRSRVMEGHTLAAGLAEFPHVFPELYRATVAAGEQSGHVDVVLERLADYTEARQLLRNKVQLALIYPIILTLVALSVVALLMVFVVPKVVQVYENTDQVLPFITIAVIAISDFLRDWGLLLLIVLAIGGAGFGWLLRKPAARYAMHQILLRLPLVKRLVRSSNSARFCRTFGILTASGVPVLDAMRISAQVLNNLPMREAVEEAARKVREGAGISKSLEVGGYFPPIVVHLIASGEASGKLEEMLDRAAVNQERELEGRVATLMGAFEPLLILVMGVFVLIIVLAILLPIFDLNQLVK